MDVGPFVVACCARELVAFVEDNDSRRAGYLGDIRDITFEGIDDAQSRPLSRAPIRFKTCNIKVEDILIDGLDLRDLENRKLVKLPECDVDLDEIRVRGQIDGVSRETFAGMPEDIDIEADLTMPGGHRMKGSPRMLRDALSD